MTRDELRALLPWPRPASAYENDGAVADVFDLQDQIVAKLVAGQTTDVEGRSIRVRGSATGRYRRL